MTRLNVFALGIKVARKLSLAQKMTLIATLSCMPILMLLSTFLGLNEPHVLHANIALLCILYLGIIIYVTISLHISVMQEVRKLLDAVRRMTAGDLLQAEQVSNSDELGALVIAINQLRHTLSGMVANVRGNAAFVAHAGKTLTRDSEDLSARTEQQAANLEETAASVEQLSSAVQMNAESAINANTRAGEVRDIAVRGAKIMAEAVTAVEAIQISARRMDEIIGVIDGLAFQTNILALNAAVEAARAGETGKGFAVVANEVRTLAQSSAASSKEIRNLIESSSLQVAESAKKFMLPALH